MPEQTTLQNTLNEMLNMAEERLDSGDYVRVANALKTASRDCEVVAPTRIIKKPINNYIKFNTIRGDVVNLVVMHLELIVMPSDIPNIQNVVYSLNGIQHTENIYSLVDKMVNIMNCVGMVYIERDYFIKYSYKNMKEFKNEVKRVAYSSDINRDNDDDDDEYCEPSDCYIIKLFLGINATDF